MQSIITLNHLFVEAVCNAPRLAPIALPVSLTSRLRTNAQGHLGAAVPIDRPYGSNATLATWVHQFGHRSLTVPCHALIVTQRLDSIFLAFKSDGGNSLQATHSTLHLLRIRCLYGRSSNNRT